MVKKILKLKNINGFCTGIAVKIFLISQNSNSKVVLKSNSSANNLAEGSSIISLLLFEVTEENEIQLIVKGGDEINVMNKIENIFSQPDFDS